MLYWILWQKRLIRFYIQLKNNFNFAIEKSITKIKELTKYFEAAQFKNDISLNK